MKPCLSIVVSLGLVSGCYLQPSAVQNPRPSPEGVAITLLGEDCEDHRGLDGDPISRDLAIKVRVDNSTGGTLTICEPCIRLLVEGDRRGVRWADLVEIAPHASATMELQFTHHSLCEPDRELVVAWNGAVTLDGRSVAVDQLAFTP